MEAAGGALALLLTVLVVLVALLFPLKAAAAAMGARRTGFFWCFLALLGASFLHGIGLAVPVIGTLVAFLLSAVAFASILGTNFLRGMGISILYVVFSAIILFVLATVFGISVLSFP